MYRDGRDELEGGLLIETWKASGRKIREERG